MTMSTKAGHGSAPSSNSAPAFPTAADIFVQIDSWLELSDQRRANLKSTLHLLARIYGLPMESIRLNPTEMADKVFGASCAALDIKPSSLTAYRSNLRAILTHLGLIDAPRRSTMTLPAEWAMLRDALPNKFLSIRLQDFMAFCSEIGILPDQVCDAVLAQYLTALRTRRLASKPAVHVNKVMQAWARARSEIPGWPQIQLGLSHPSQRYALPFTAYPARLQAEVSEFLDSMDAQKVVSLFLPTGSGAPKSKATLMQREKCIKLALAALVQTGSSPDSLISLTILVEPENLKKIIDWHWNRAGQRVTDHIGAITATLRIVCKHLGIWSAALNDILRVGKPKKRARMTKKRELRMQQLDDPDNEARLLHLPRRLMVEARALMAQAQRREAALLAGTAVAIAIELRCPMRIKNLAGLRMGVDIIKLDSRSTVWTHFRIDERDVKNDVPLDWPINPDLASLMDVYVNEFRVHLNHCESTFLFPHRDCADRPRLAITLGQAMSREIHRFIGIDLSPHDFRAFAGVHLLKTGSGSTEDLQHILGHKTPATALSYYTSFRPKWAAERYNALLDSSTAKMELRAEVAFGRSAAGPSERSSAKTGNRL
jgi:integrase